MIINEGIFTINRHKENDRAFLKIISAMRFPLPDKSCLLRNDIDASAPVFKMCFVTSGQRNRAQFGLFELTKRKRKYRREVRAGN